MREAVCWSVLFGLVLGLIGCGGGTGPGGAPGEEIDLARFTLNEDDTSPLISRSVFSDGTVVDLWAAPGDPSRAPSDAFLDANAGNLHLSLDSEGLPAFLTFEDERGAHSVRFLRYYPDTQEVDIEAIGPIGVTSYETWSTEGWGLPGSMLTLASTGIPELDGATDVPKKFLRLFLTVLAGWAVWQSAPVWIPIALLIAAFNADALPAEIAELDLGVSAEVPPGTTFAVEESFESPAIAAETWLDCSDGRDFGGVAVSSGSSSGYVAIYNGPGYATAGEQSIYMSNAGGADRVRFTFDSPVTSLRVDIIGLGSVGSQTMYAEVSHGGRLVVAGQHQGGALNRITSTISSAAPFQWVEFRYTGPNDSVHFDRLRYE